MKFMQERIANIEKNTGDLCESLGEYTRQAARFRDKTDDLVATVDQFATSELVNRSLQTGLQCFASSYSSIGDHRDAFIRRLETHVVSAFTSIGAQCKDIRDEVKTTFSAKDRETVRKKQVDKLKQKNTRNRQKILMAETDLARASADVSRSLRALEEHMEAFEAQKLSTVTGALRSLLRAELALHAKEMELLTKAYTGLAQIDEQQDLEAFHSAIQSPPETILGKSALKETLRNSLAGLFLSSNTSSSSFSSDKRSGNISATLVSTPSSPISGTSTPITKTISLHHDPGEDDTETGSSEGTSTSDEDLMGESSAQKSHNTSQFLRRYK